MSVQAVSEIDRAVLQKIERIMKLSASRDTKYELLDQLQLTVMQQHPDGLAADVLQNISAATTQVLCASRKGGGLRDNLPH
jgi:hypothetical protein